VLEVLEVLEVDTRERLEHLENFEHLFVRKRDELPALDGARVLPLSRAIAQ
jgi:hypothetical protein